MECSDRDSEYSEGDQDYDDYYDSMDNGDEHMDEGNASAAVNTDPEYVEYLCLDSAQVHSLLQKDIDEVIGLLSIRSSMAKLLLYLNRWDIEKVKKQFVFDFSNDTKIRKCTNPQVSAPKSSQKLISNTECLVCYDSKRVPLSSLECGHMFCRSCWQYHFDTQLQNGVTVKLECMFTDCHLICQEEFVFNILSNNAKLKAKYEQLSFRDFIQSHPHLRWCPGRECNIVIYCKTNKAHRVTCSSCTTRFCFLCGQDYHAPASCDIIKKWLIKCADDSETANYISAHTKDCPNCHSCIEKNGGCNHMQCSKCKYHFCWMCFKDWKSHGSEYYECSRYKENPAIAQETNHLKARRALEKYLHYYERFENHNKSLKMEEEMQVRIQAKIEEKISRHEGTWIDWQYLHAASHLLTKCRYTLQYTYPFAYYMDSSGRKELFEYQQAQLEKEIEELSWKVERAETTDRGELESQMHIAEQKRRTLLQDFFD